MNRWGLCLVKLTTRPHWRTRYSWKCGCNQIFSKETQPRRFYTMTFMSNILTQSWLLNRRHFLRGLGAAVALPLLDCMRPLAFNSAQAAAAAASKPRRSVFVYIPNGVNVLTWQITSAGKDYHLVETLLPPE